MTLLCYNIFVKVKVFAKLNLTLQVGAKQGQFHPIDSVATSIDICDTVEVTVRHDAHIWVYDLPQVATEQNSAYRAAVAFQRMFSTHGVEICVKKGIPFGGGLGGSSADAAAVIYCMCKLFDVEIHSQKIHALCSALGSDIYFMLFGGLGRLQGKGDDVTYCNMAKPLYFALTTFDVAMNSGEIYSAFDKLNVCKEAKLPLSLSTAHCECCDVKSVGVDSVQTDGLSFQNSVNDKLLHLLQQGENGKAAKLFSNGLQQATLSVSDYAKEYLNFVQSQKLSCNMTGSGSAYYVACQTPVEAQHVADLLNAHGYTTAVCVSVPRGVESKD